MIGNSQSHDLKVTREYSSRRTQTLDFLGLVAVLVLPAVQAIHFGSRVLNWLPVWSWYADPGYQYLLNGAVIVKGGVPGHTDHPGTSTQWLIGLIEQITYWISGTESSIFVDLVYNPEEYAKVVSWVLLALYIAVLMFLGIRMWREFGNSVAILTQLMLLWSISLLGSGVFKLVPETLVLLAFIALIALLTGNLKNPRKATGIWVVIAVGMVCAVGVTSKIIFLPALVLPVILLRVRDLFISIAAFLVSTVLIMIPTYPRLDQMWTWYSGVLLNSGRHGGQVELSTVDNLLNAFDGITGIVRWWNLIALLLIGLSLALYVVPNLRKRIGAGILSLTSIVLNSLAIIAMGYKQSETRDFLLLGVSVAVGAGILLWLYRTVLPRRIGLIITGVSILAATFLASHGLVGSTYGYPLTTERSAERVASAKLMNALAERGILAQSYDSWTESGALSFGEYWTNGEFAQAIAERFPDTYEYSIWDQRVYSWNAGKGRLALSCSEIVELTNANDVFIVVPGVGTLEIDEKLQNITSPDGNIVVSQMDPIGPNSVFKIVEMQCQSASRVSSAS